MERWGSAKSWLYATTALALFLLLLPLCPARLVAQETTKSSVVISEFMAINVSTLTDANGDYSDWIELYNPSDTPIDLRGWFLSDDPAQLDKWTFPSVRIPAGGFLIVFASGKDRLSGELHTNFKLDGQGEFLALMNDRFEVVTRFFPTYPPQFPDISYGYGMDLETRTLVDADSSLQFRVPVSREDDDSWFLPEFPATDWTPGKQPLGFDLNIPANYADSIVTDVHEVMDGINSSVYVRLPFQLDENAARVFRFVRTRLQYDDGIAVWVNGERIANENNFQSLDYNSRARTDRSPEDAKVPQEIHPTDFGGFREGTNVLAVQVLNRNSRDQDLFLLCELEAIKVKEIWTQSPVYLSPRPRRPNGPGFTEVATRPTASLPNGVYTDEITVELSTAEADAEIRFTTDGSQPVENSSRYEAPLRISASTELRARSFRPSRLGSPTLTMRYVIVAPDTREVTSDLPLVVVSTFGRSLSTADWTPCHLEVFDRSDDGRARFTESPHLVAPAGIKVRGSSSASWPKRSYAIEIGDALGEDSDYPLLGMPAESDWILWPPYSTDPSMVRNAFAYGIANQVGLYSARTRFCEVYLDTESEALSAAHYVGVYVLMEKIKRAPSRIDVAEILPHHDQLPEISGGYILRIDRLDPGDTGFGAGGMTLGFGEPKESDVTGPQLAWITDYLNDFNSALQGEHFDHPVSGYRRYIETESWILHHMVNVLCKNVDGLRLSTFLYKDRDDKLEMGPVWDFDLSMDSPDSRDNNPQTMRGSGDATDYFNMHWWQRLFEDPAFRRQYNDRWSELRRGPLSNKNIETFLDSMANELRESQVRNFERWPRSFPHGSWEGEIEHLKRWLTVRANWLDTQFLPVPQIRAEVDIEAGEATVAIDLNASASPDGQIFYTLDGSDPRGSSSLPSPHAFLYGGPFVVNRNATIQTRYRSGASWSLMTGKTVVVNIPTLTISEIHFQPAAPPPGSAYVADDFEFIELYNYGLRTVALDGLSFSRGVGFEFADGGVREIGAGDRLVVVANLEAFSEVYAEFFDTGDIVVAGEFEGELRDGGESVSIAGEIGNTILRFVYRDLWYPETAGGGHSLVLVDPEGTSEPDMSLKESWRPSQEIGGAPGRRDAPFPEGYQIPGDTNQDSRLNLSDAARLARILFTGDGPGFPCETVESNLKLLDLGGDNTIDGSDVVALLLYLFLDGPIPAGGQECTEIEGCPGICEP